jgi:hypothetical protein
LTIDLQEEVEEEEEEEEEEDRRPLKGKPDEWDREVKTIHLLA